jgi:hypothetical protein
MAYIQTIAIKSAQRVPLLNLFVRGEGGLVSEDLAKFFSIAKARRLSALQQRLSNSLLSAGLKGRQLR